MKYTNDLKSDYDNEGEGRRARRTNRDASLTCIYRTLEHMDRGNNKVNKHLKYQPNSSLRFPPVRYSSFLPIITNWNTTVADVCDR